MSFRKLLETHYFKILSRLPDGSVMYGLDIGYV